MEQAIAEQFDFDPKKILRIVRRRIKPMLITSTIFLFVSLLIVMLLPKVYKSTATILIEQQEIPQDLVRSTVTSYADQRVQVIMQRAMTFSNLTQIIKKFSLYSDIYKREPMEKIVAMMKNDIHHNMISADVVDPRSGRPVEATLAFSIGFESKSPKLAQQVANELSNLFINENLRTRRDMANQTADFLLSESESLEKRITDTETRMAKFKEEYMDSLPELVDLNLKLMDRTEQDLLEADRQMRILKEKKIYLQAEIAKTQPYSPLYAASGERVMSPDGRLKVLKSQYLSMVASYSQVHPEVIKIKKEIESLEASLGSDNVNSKAGFIADLNKQILELEGSKSQLLETYSEKHPDIVELNRKLDVLYIQLANYEKNISNISSSSTVNDADNPIYIQLQTQLDVVRTELNSEETRKQKLEDKLKEYERRIVESPQIEKAYSELLRNHRQLILQHQEVNSKLMDANISRSMERESKGERFTLIEPAMVPQVPVKPNRKVLLALAVLVSLLVGAGLVWFLEKTDKSIRSWESLFQLSGVPPLAEIPLILNNEDIQKQKALVLKLAVSIILIIFLSLFMINFFYKPLDVLWFLIWRKLGIL